MTLLQVIPATTKTMKVCTLLTLPSAAASTASAINWVYVQKAQNIPGELIQTGQKFSNSYPVSLFPTVFLSQKLKHDQEVQVSATRRINRPNFFQLIPFADSTDKLNITKGNPGLVPEFTQSLELSYLKTFKGNHTLLSSVYYKHTDNTITSFIDRQTDPTTGNTALINTYVNASSSYTTGAEFTVQNYFTKWWDMSTNINLYNSKINANAVRSAGCPVEHVRKDQQ